MKHRPFVSDLFALLAALAAVLQWSIPQGWMIGADSHGKVTLMPCPGALAGHAKPADNDIPHLHGAHGGNHASAHQEMAHHGSAHQEWAHHDMAHTHDGGEIGDARTLCDFVALGAPLLAPQPPDLGPIPPLDSKPLPPSIAAAPGRGLAAPPPPSTGPPFLKA